MMPSNKKPLVVKRRLSPLTPVFRKKGRRKEFLKTILLLDLETKK